MARNALSELLRNSQKYGASVLKVRSLILDEAHSSVPGSQEKSEHIRRLRRAYSNKPNNR